MATEKKRRAVLSGKFIEILWGECQRAVAGANRAIEKRIDAAETRLGEILNLKVDLTTGQMDYKLPERGEYEFTEYELFGMKTALVQAISGIPNMRHAAAHGYKKYTLTPIAKELGILSVVLKETKTEDTSQDFSLEFDGETKEVDLGPEPAAAPAAAEPAKEEAPAKA